MLVVTPKTISFEKTFFNLFLYMSSTSIIRKENNSNANNSCKGKFDNIDILF